jgi:hypothetical protein
MNQHQDIPSRNIAQQLDANARASLDAEDAHVRVASGGVVWERRGWLGRLTRVQRPPQRIDRQAERSSPDEERRVA